MPLEATVVCLDNSEFTRNGDYAPTRGEAQSDAVNLLCNAKNTVGLLSMAGPRPEVLVTLTSDLGKLLSALAEVKTHGELDFLTGIQVAQLILKHRQNKNQHQRIVAFVGSPVKSKTEELVDLAKKLKKNNVAVDIVNFGEERANQEKLEAFIGAVNNNDNSHLIPVPPGPHILSDILVTSPLFFSEEGAAGGGGAGGEAGGAPAAGGGGMGGFAVDPNMDPELAEALRVSLLEEQERKRKEDAEAAKKAGGAAPAAGGEKKPDAVMADIDPNMDPELAEAMRLSMSTAAPEPAKPPAPAKPPVPAPKLDEMSEEEQMRIAMEMSMVAENPATPAPAKPAGATVTPATAPSPATPAAPKQGGDVDMSDVMNDPAFVANLLKTLPGVDTNDPGIKNIISGMQSQNKDEKKDDKKDDKNKK